MIELRVLALAWGLLTVMIGTTVLVWVGVVVAEPVATGPGERMRDRPVRKVAAARAAVLTHDFDADDAAEDSAGRGRIPKERTTIRTRGGEIR